MLEFVDISFSYREDLPPVFSGFSFHALPGEFMLIKGQSGIGKSTLIKLILKELTPTGGRILMNGRDVTDLKRSRIPDYRRKLGVIFQDFRLIKDRTVYENIDMVRICTGGSKKDSPQRIHSLLRMLGIDHLFRRYPGELSGGEQQKVALARALVNNPGIILADEPTGNLDPEASREVMGLFDIISRQGITVVAATHDPGAAKGLKYKMIELVQ